MAQLVKLLLSSEATDESADRCLQLLTARIRSGEIAGESLTNIQTQLADPLTKAMSQKLSRPSTLSAVELAASLKMQEGINRASQLNSMTDDELIRLRLINSLITANDDSGLIYAESLLMTSRSADARRKAVQAIGRIGTTKATDALARHLPKLPADVQPAVVEAMTDREESAPHLMAMVRNKTVPQTLINANQADKMLSLKSQPLTDLVTKHWGSRSHRTRSLACN